ncbi:bifunctional DNA primase/polymerase [Kitasatospora sp. NA04385]|uniref:bifunctional DNA primase/polymerase n=1 Tax=Kitasatospora sp. NA04385 TaxID=2742135 RepID=UPI0034CD2823
MFPPLVHRPIGACPGVRRPNVPGIVWAGRRGATRGGTHSLVRWNRGPGGRVHPEVWGILVPAAGSRDAHAPPATPSTPNTPSDRSDDRTDRAVRSDANAERNEPPCAHPAESSCPSVPAGGGRAAGGVRWRSPPRWRPPSGAAGRCCRARGRSAGRRVRARAPTGPARCPAGTRTTRRWRRPPPIRGWCAGGGAARAGRPVLAATGRALGAVSLPRPAGPWLLRHLEEIGVPCGPVLGTPGRFVLLTAPYTLPELGGMLAERPWVPGALRYHGPGGYLVLPPSRTGAGPVHWVRRPGRGRPWLPEVGTLLGGLITASAVALPQR